VPEEQNNAHRKSSSNKGKGNLNKTKEKGQGGATRLQLDQIMKSMFSVSPGVMIKMLNSLFKENYPPEDTEITLTNNEFILEYKGYDIIRGDLFVKLQTGCQKPNHYHIDFQTLYDREMIIRMFAYGLSKARELSNNQHSSADSATIYIPRQLVIYMEQHGNIEDKLALKIVFPDGEVKIHEVAVMKYWQYKAADLVEKELYPLLPLQLFRLRHKLKLLSNREIVSTEEMQETLTEIKDLITEVGEESRRLHDRKTISGEDHYKILLAVHHLFAYLNENYGNNEQLNKEVGKMLKTLIDPAVEEKGRIQGIEIGREEGREEGLEIGREEGLEIGREEIKSGIHELLSDFGDYTQYKGELSSRLCDIKDLSKMKELFMTAARVKSAKEFIDRL
jgi:hypothetical protein